jgi:integrase/recombinase XerD
MPNPNSPRAPPHKDAVREVGMIGESARWRLCRTTCHTFALEALLRWYRSGADVQAKLPLLATYMGHVSIASTEYYLKFVEPLGVSASDRFARHCGDLVTTRISTRGER